MLKPEAFIAGDDILINGEIGNEMFLLERGPAPSSLPDPANARMPKEEALPCSQSATTTSASPTCRFHPQFAYSIHYGSLWGFQE
jgi:hypothetical protein